MRIEVEATYPFISFPVILLVSSRFSASSKSSAKAAWSRRLGEGDIWEFTQRGPDSGIIP